MSTPFWISAFLDLPASSFERGVMFWSEVTGSRVSAPRGARHEFATLVPPNGDPHLKVQRRDEGATGIHLDLHVDDSRAAAAEAVSLGATMLRDQVVGDGYVVLSSPGGFVFCFVGERLSRRSTPVAWADGAASAVDQVCLDIPKAAYDEECAFWAAVTGWDLLAPQDEPEFHSLCRPSELPLRLLLQRLDEPTGQVRAHLDLACDDRPAETRRHAGLGAQLEREHAHWTVLRDPAGATYCITDRHPVEDGPG